VEGLRVGFEFEYVGFTTRDAGCGTWVAAGDQQWALLGRLTGGRIALGDRILLPTASGVPFRGYVARFAESFSNWLGLPLYMWLTPNTMPGAFCLCVGGPQGEPGIVCPGVARSEGPASDAESRRCT
jgi:hypothetical protein